MNKTCRLILILLAFSAAPSLYAQDSGFIYGKIYTFGGHDYKGPIRWGKEEVYWTDLFNASKENNENLNYLSRAERDELDESQAQAQRGSMGAFAFLQRFNIGRAFENEYTHQFTCQFGDIKSLRPFSFGKKVEVESQSGARFIVNGSGYNDIGGDIKIIDEKAGALTIRWGDIDRIEFMSTPAHLPVRFGAPLYGTVESYHGTFTGYVQWDNDERLTTDKLDGNFEGKRMSIPFGSIASIDSWTSSSRVVIKSGEEYELRGTNDVNTGNRGIIITTEEGLIVEVPWREFRKLTLNSVGFYPQKNYESFGIQKEINSTIITSDGKSLTGNAVIDLDERYDFELIQGKYQRIEYTIPLRLIKKITVSQRNGAEIFLLTGKKLVLEESQDVGEFNQGVLVFNKSKDPVYIPWQQVSEIQLNR